MDGIEVAAIHLKLTDSYTRARITCSRTDHGDAIVLTMKRAVLQEFDREIVRQTSLHFSKSNQGGEFSI
jgi:hypothetical protein